MTQQPARITDTTPEAAATQAAALRLLSPLERLELAVDMSATVRTLLRARLQVAHPQWAERDLDREVLRCTLPNNLLPPALQ
jgi:Rv0078B-related antitoxin